MGHPSSQKSKIQNQVLSQEMQETKETQETQDTQDTEALMALKETGAKRRKESFILFSGTDNRCTLLIQTSMTTLSLREELIVHENQETTETEALASWGRAVAIARHASTAHAKYVQNEAGHDDMFTGK